MLVIASASWTGANAQYWEAQGGRPAHVGDFYFLLFDSDLGSNTAILTTKNYAGNAAGKNSYTKSNVTIPETIQSENENNELTTYTVIGIDDYTFYGSTNVKKIDIPKTVLSIGKMAFEDCTSLEQIIVNPESQNYYAKDNVLYNFTQTELIACAKTKAGKITVPEDVIKINEFAFCDCENITEIVLPNGLKEIGKGAFWGCTNMTSINIPTSLTTLGSDAFRDDSSLSSSITIPASLSLISSNAFMDCSKLSNVTIEDGVTEIAEFAFSGCSKITSIELPSSLNSIGTFSFANTGLTSISIPYSITSIPSSAFSGCKLTSITLPKNLQTIGGEAFANNGTNIQKVEIPESVTNISSKAFYGTNVSNFYINNIPSKIAIGANNPFKADGVTIHVFTMMKSIFQNATNWSNYASKFVDDIEITHVESIALESDKMTVLTNSTNKLNATINPADARVKDVVYTSSNPNVILIIDPATGIFSAGANEGDATVTCTAADGSGVFATCSLTVKKSFTPAESLTLDKTNESMEVGNTLQLKATISPTNATYKKVVWISDNENVATVSETGDLTAVVTAVGSGNATITAISQDGAARAKCKISVTFGTYTLTDGEDYTKTEDNFVKTLKYVRTFKSKTWQCFYVPFDISYDDWKDHFEIATINNLHQYDKDGDGIAETNEIEAIYQRTGKTIKAHTLCVIRTLDDVDANHPKTITITVNNATLRKAESKTVDCSSVSTTFAFHGTDSKVSGQVMVDNNYYSMSATTGKFARATNPDKHHVNGLRWYLDIIDRSTGNSSSAKAGEISIVAIEEGEVTGIANIEGGTDNKIVSIFDANGRKMNGFQKGLNIVKYSDGTTKKIMK